MNPKQSQQRYARTVRLLQVILLLLIFAVMGTAGMALMSGPRLFFPPTPTLTATPGAPLTPTPDFRTTLIAEDIATQDAYATLVVASGGRLSPLGLPTTATVAVAPAVMPTATVPLDGNVTPTPDGLSPISVTAVVIALPLVNVGQPDSVLPPPTDTPFPGEFPTETPSPTLPPDAFPTETPTPTLIAFPTETPTPTPTLFVMATLRAFVTVNPGATVYTGPSSQYGVVGSVNVNQEVILSSRDETGEWLYACCVNNSPYWIRQASAPPRDNALPGGAPANATPNDARWLMVQQAPPTTTPILTPTPVPPESYPFYRYVRGNNSRVANLPQPPFQPDWPSPYRALKPMSSAVLVAGGYVLVASQDNQLYGLDRTFGNQQWAYPLPQPMFNAPVAQDSMLYFVGTGGTIYTLNIVGNQVQPLWSTAINGQPLSSLYLADARLYLIMQESDTVRRVLTLDRNTGALLAERYPGTNQLSPYLAVGNQSLYIGDPGLRAIDLNKLDIVWQQPGVPNLNAPPLYVTNGPVALAELYVADNQNRVYLLNANTGQIIWTMDHQVAVTGMAVGDEILYISGNGYLIALERRTGAFIWRAEVPGTVLGGPIVDADQVMVVTNSGMMSMYDRSKNLLANVTIPSGAQAMAPPAISGVYLYVPASDGLVYAWRGQP